MDMIILRVMLSVFVFEVLISGFDFECVCVRFWPQNFQNDNRLQLFLAVELQQAQGWKDTWCGSGRKLYPDLKWCPFFWNDTKQLRFKTITNMNVSGLVKQGLVSTNGAPQALTF